MSLGVHAMLQLSFPQAMANADTVMASADLPAAPDEVIAALVTREVERWWGSAETYRMIGWNADLRVGGNWSVVVKTADGRRLHASGEFLEVEVPRRIVQTRRYDWDHPALGRKETWLTCWSRSAAARGSSSVTAASRVFRTRRPSTPTAGHGYLGGCSSTWKRTHETPRRLGRASLDRDQIEIRRSSVPPR
ncbi:SRPBCC domain-containing protein [Mesorhizobium sp.]|uniref:SRPBCC family protein n=1 Tax=Mesorhizobium sp. TaxID=1871066 RepID=UPI0025EE9D94|nr:SRPBCC domain-containing protein [Mesorhizobium sp.]